MSMKFWMRGEGFGTAAFGLLCAGLFLFPVLGAGIFTRTVCGAGFLSSLLLAAYTLYTARHEPMEREGAPTALRWVLVAIFVFLIVCTLPLPMFLTALTGVSRQEENQTLAAILQRADEAQLFRRPPLFFSIGRNRAGALRILALAVVVVGFGSAARMMPLRLRRTYLRFVAVAGALLGIVGHIGRWHIPQGYTLLWRTAVAPVPPGPIACFINPNHFAGFLALCGAVALALAVDDFARRRVGRGLWMAALFLIMGLTSVGSTSRGGLLALAGGVAGVVAALTARRRLIPALGACALAGAVVAGVFFYANPAVRERLASLRHVTQTSSYVARVTAWKDSLGILRRYPILGAGPNAYRMVFARHRTTTERSVRDFAENEYVQLAAEGGLVGIGLAMALTVALIQGIRSARKAAPPDGPILAAGIGVLGAAAFHATVETALHLPYYAAVLASVVGLLYPPAPPHTQDLVTPRWWRRPRIGPSLLLFAVAVALWPLAKSMQKLDTSGFASASRPPALARGLVWAPTWPYAWNRLAEQIARHPSPEALPIALACAETAMRYDPNNYRRWYTVGDIRLRMGDRRGARAAFDRVKQLKPWIAVPVVPKEGK